MNKNSHGIGLHVCKRIIEGLKGSLTFSSHLGLGSCFTLSFQAELVEKIFNQADIEKFKNRIGLKAKHENRKSKQLLGDLLKIKTI